MVQKKKDSKIIEIQMKIQSFKTLDFASHKLPRDIDDIGPIRFDFRNEVLIEKNLKTVIIRLHVDAIYEKGKEKFQVGAIETESVFALVGLKIPTAKGASLKFPEGLLITFLSIAYSSTRGALSSKGAGTILEKAIMPLIDNKVFRPILEQIKHTDLK